MFWSQEGSGAHPKHKTPGSHPEKLPVVPSVAAPSKKPLGAALGGDFFFRELRCPQVNEIVN